MKALALLTIALISTTSNATTFLACIGNTKSEVVSNGKNPYYSTKKDVKFQIEFDNFEGLGTAKYSMESSTSSIKNCTFTTDWIDCKDKSYMSSKMGEVTKLGITASTTSMFSYETKLKINRKTGLGEFLFVNDSKITEPKDKAQTYYSSEQWNFLCMPATANQF